MAFSNFDRSGHRMLSAEITRELQALAQRHGLTIDAGGGSIGTDNLVIKVTARTNDTAAIEAKARRELAYEGRYLGLVADDYGAVFSSNGKSYRLTGVHSSRPKYPISGVCLSTGRCFKFPSYIARNIIAARPAVTATPTQAARPSAPANSNSHAGAFDHMAQF